MKMHSILLQVGILAILAMAVAPATANAEQMVTSSGSASAQTEKVEKSRETALLTLEGEGLQERTASIPAGTTRLWMRRVSGPGALQDRGVPYLALRRKDGNSREYRVVGNDGAMNGTPAGEILTVAVDHGSKWATTKILANFERKGSAASSSEGSPMWAELYLDHGVAISTRSANPGFGGVNVRIFKDLGGDMVVFAGMGHDWDWQSPSWYVPRPMEGQGNRGELGFGLRPPMGLAILGGLGVDLGDNGLGASRPLTFNGEVVNTLIPGDTEWQGSVKADGHAGQSGWQLGLQGSGDVLLYQNGPVNILGGAELVIVADNGNVKSTTAGPKLTLQYHLDDWTVEGAAGTRLGRDGNQSVLIPNGGLSLTRRY